MRLDVPIAREESANDDHSTTVIASAAYPVVLAPLSRTTLLALSSIRPASNDREIGEAYDCQSCPDSGDL
ncbi:hypothetical protein NSI01_34700 [Pimelobacter simplex]|nr:hypothetical protein NSI01_34700 [Pimelobacter simplex]